MKTYCIMDDSLFDDITVMGVRFCIVGELIFFRDQHGEYDDIILDLERGAAIYEVDKDNADIIRPMRKEFLESWPAGMHTTWKRLIEINAEGIACEHGDWRDINEF